MPRWAHLSKKKASSKTAKWQRVGGRKKEANSQNGIRTIKTIHEQLKISCSSLDSSQGLGRFGVGGKRTTKGHSKGQEYDLWMLGKEAGEKRVKMLTSQPI